eukprot:gb/GECH01012174.1/.p1 GENE.gb/GECH01012174.1/~~gb/GECH01012174.1/.p1  ORF type:complete len:107 (+),score=31.17 gb/GECH01012174.1/:1-321(+)
MSHHPSYSLGALAATGGVMGYLKAGSKPSLIAGVASGSLLILAGNLIQNGKTLEGHSLATVVSGALMVAMTRRFIKKGGIFPAGIVAGLATLNTGYNQYKFIQYYS